MTTRFPAVLTGVLLMCVLLSSCRTSPETLFDGPALSVTVPEGWKSGRVQDPASSGNFRRLEIMKKGGAAIAEVNISWYDEILDLQTTIADRMKRIEDVRFFKVQFGETAAGSYGRYEGLMARSNEKKWGLELQVVMYCFHAGGKTFVIWTGDAVEDLPKHRPGFELIENSFLAR